MCYSDKLVEKYLYFLISCLILLNFSNIGFVIWCIPDQHGNYLAYMQNQLFLKLQFFLNQIFFGPKLFSGIASYTGKFSVYHI